MLNSTPCKEEIVRKILKVKNETFVNFAEAKTILEKHNWNDAFAIEEILKRLRTAFGPSETLRDVEDTKIHRMFYSLSDGFRSVTAKIMGETDFSLTSDKTVDALQIILLEFFFEKAPTESYIAEEMSLVRSLMREPVYFLKNSVKTNPHFVICTPRIRRKEFVYDGKQFILYAGSNLVELKQTLKSVVDFEHLEGLVLGHE